MISETIYAISNAEGKFAQSSGDSYEFVKDISKAAKFRTQKAAGDTMATIASCAGLDIDEFKVRAFLVTTFYCEILDNSGSN